MRISGKYLKICEVKENNGFKKINLGESRKDNDGKYVNWTWFDCLLLGDARDAEIAKGDIVNIEGSIEMRNYNDKWYNNIIIWQIENVEKNSKTKTEPEQKPEQKDLFSEDKTNDDLPF